MINSAGTVSTLGSGGTSAMTHLAETIVTGSVAANIDFTSISGGYRALLLQLVARGDTAASNTTVTVQLNADTTANYDWENVTFYGASGTTSGSEGVGSTAMILGTMTAASGPASVAGFMELSFPDYARTAWQKVVSGRGSAKLGTTTGSFSTGTSAGFWHSTAAITEIKLIPTAGNFSIGTICTLFGIL